MARCGEGRSFGSVGRLLVFGVVFEEVVRNVVDGVFGLDFFLGEGGERFEDEGDDGFVEVGPDGESLEAVLGRLWV